MTGRRNNSHEAAFARELSYAGGEVNIDIQDVVSRFLLQLRQTNHSGISSEQPVSPPQKQHDDDALIDQQSWRLEESLGREQSEYQSGMCNSEPYIPCPVHTQDRTQLQEHDETPKPREEINQNQLTLKEALILNKALMISHRTAPPADTAIDAGQVPTAYTSAVLAIRREIEEQLRLKEAQQ